MLIDILSENIEYEVANDFSLVNGTSLQGTVNTTYSTCLLYTSPSPRDLSTSRMPSSA